MSRRVYKARRAQTMTLESMYTTLLPHVGHIDVRVGCTVLYSHCGVDMRQTYGLQSRRHSRTLLQHGPQYKSIYRVAMQQKLLVKFSCNPHYQIALLRALLICTIIGLCGQWLLQHNRLSKMTHFENISKEISEAVERQCVKATQAAREHGFG